MHPSNEAATAAVQRGNLDLQGRHHMAPSNDKEAHGAGEQDAEGEDGAVRGARSQVTGSGALVYSPPRLGSAVAPEAFHTEGSVSTVLSTCTGRQRRRMAGTDGQDRC